MAQKLVELAGGLVLIDDDATGPLPPSRLQVLADEVGVPDEKLRQVLRDEVQRRRREVGSAWEKLDNRLEKRASD